VETLIHKDRRKSQRVAVQMTLQGQVEGRLITMQSENISLDGMFLSCKEFIRPRAGFFARLWLPTTDASMQVYLTSSFIEQTWAGYGIGVHISGVSTADRARWEAFYRDRVAQWAAQQRHRILSAPALQNRRIAVLGGALNPLAVQALRKQGLVVSSVHSVEQAIELIQTEPVDAVLSDVRHPGADGLALCCAIRARRLSTRTVLLTDSATPKEFLLGLFAGATRVIAKSYSNELLVDCVLEVIQQPLHDGRPGAVAADEAEETAPAEWLQPSDILMWDDVAETVDQPRAA